MGRRSFITAALTLFLVLNGCMAPPRPIAPADIPPHWQVRNSPVPVPHPVRRPAPPLKAGAAPAIPPRPPGPVAGHVDVSAITGKPAAVAPARTVTVQRGDTVYAISRRHDADVRAIIAANRLTPPYILHPGMRLRLPAARVHVVARGETTYSISRHYGVDLSELAKMNGLGPPYMLRVGQRLALPGVAAEASGSGALVNNNRGPLPPPPSRLGFAWPVEGRLLSSFGAKAGGLHNDGINVVAEQGAPVVAADAGVVAYAGSDLRAFGNLVLVQHQGGWVTAYAHLDQVAVSRGQRLSRGERLGSVGQTGGVSRPQLHFEIRQGRRAVDPMQHLPKS